MTDDVAKSSMHVATIHNMNVVIEGQVKELAHFLLFLDQPTATGQVGKADR
jgi:hypothetical protein